MPDEPETKPGSRPSLSHRITLGYVWMASQTLLAKVCTTLGQIALAWYLIPDEFGLVAIAYVFGVLPALIQQGGLKEVLIRRGKRIDRWANPAFWLGMALGLGGCIAMLMLSPLASMLDDDPRLIWLLLIVGMQFPAGALGIVPHAMLEARFRFRTSALLYSGQAIAQIIMAVIFAGVFEWGPYALVVPRPLALLGSSVIAWIAVRPRIRMHLQFRRWKYLAGDGAVVILGNACDILMGYSGYLILSLYQPTEIVGLYYFAFNMSQQTMTLIVIRLRGVLFPVLSSLQDDAPRQTAAFLRALRLMACIVVAASLLQAALADPGLRALFKERWFPAIPMLQILSLAMVIRSLGWPAIAMLQAQGRFLTRLKLAGCAMGLLVVLGCVGAMTLGGVGVALAVLLQLAIIEPLNLYVSVRPTGHGWRDIGRAVALPSLLGVLSVGIATLASLAVPAGSLQPWIQIGVILVVSAALYFPLFRLLVPDAWSEGVARLRPILASARNRLPGAAERTS